MQRLRLSMDSSGDDPPTAEECLRRNVLELMRFYKMTQTDLAEKIGRGQSWLSRRLSGKPWDKGGSRFQFQDIDRLAAVFGLSPAELLQSGHGNLDRRTGDDRRSGADRRHARPFPHTRMPQPQRRHDDTGLSMDGDGDGHH